MLRAKTVLKSEDAPWALFLHGFGGSGETWQKQVADFGARYNLLLVDFHGEEEREALSVEGLCAQLAELLESLEAERVCVVSMSSGTLVALAFAALYPHKVWAVVLAGGMLSFRWYSSLLLWLARVLRNVVPYMYLYRFFAWIIMPGNNHQKSRHIFVREAKKLGHREFCRWVRLVPALLQNESYIQSLRQLSFAIPFLYIMGEQDRIFLPAIQKDVFRLKNAEVAVLPACGHVCAIECAELFNKTALDFLRKQI